MTRDQINELLGDMDNLNDLAHDALTDIEDSKFAINEFRDELKNIQKKLSEYLEKENNENTN